MREWWDMLKATWAEFRDDNCPRLAAALSYATIFSIPPLLILILLVLGAVVDVNQLQQEMQGQLSSLMGAEGAAEITGILQTAQRPEMGRPLAAIIGIGALIIGAIGAFLELQSDLNTVWEVAPDPERGGIKAMLLKRVLSFGMVGAIAFLLLVSLVVSALVSAFGDLAASYLPGWASGALLQGVNLGISLAVIWLLFAGIFKVLPDADIDWSDVWVGALATAVLFVGGKYLIGLYLAHSNPGQSFGAAGSLVVVLVWIYYSSWILFFGAEFTQVWAQRRGNGIRPSKGAVRLERQVRRADEAAASAGQRGEARQVRGRSDAA